MRKEYRSVVHIAVSSSTTFSKCVGDAILELQGKGMQVEVQYASNGTMFTAVVLGFTKQHEGKKEA